MLSHHLNNTNVDIFMCHKHETVTGGALTSFYFMLIVHMVCAISYFAVQPDDGFQIAETRIHTIYKK